MENSTHPVALPQSDLYASAVRALGGRAERADLPGATPLVLRRRWPLLGDVALISRGPIGTSDDLRRTLAARHLIVNAEATQDATRLARLGFLRLAAPRTIAELPLHPDLDVMLAAMTGKWRNRLRHGMAQGLTIRNAPLPPDPQHWLFHKDAAQQHVRGYRGLHPALIAAMAAADPEAVTLLVAKDGPHPIAAMLFACHGTTASYLVGWSDAAGRAASAHNLLMWHAMQDMEARGVTRIDLGLCDAAPGLARFKRGSGAVVRALGGTWLASRVAAPLHALLQQARRPIPGRARTRPAAGRCTDPSECN